MNAPLVDVIIPTLNNPDLLISCLSSYDMAQTYTTNRLVRYIVVNNGHPAIGDKLIESDRLKVLTPGKNLGWEGGLKLGLSVSKAPFVIFSNDDIRLLTGQPYWLWTMLSTFNDPAVGAVGPASNFVMGPQNIFADIQGQMLETKFLIGFMLLVSREALDRVGGVDDTLPGGDDIDLSIRLRDAGYKLVARRDVFVFHHGQMTGQRVHPGYWNSNTMQERTNLAIIRKHGMLKFFETMVRGSLDFSDYNPVFQASADVEGDICRRYVVGDNVLELGCGGRLTHDKAIGIDIMPNGSKIPFVTEDHEACVASLNADASIGVPVKPESQDTVIARHLLEHCQDTLGTISAWNRALKPGGTLIIAVPNQALGNTILMNPEHVVTFTPQSLKSLAAVSGFEQAAIHEDVNGCSFVAVFTKTAQPDPRIASPQPTTHPKSATLLKEAACA